jgi:hypothetical protein
MTTTLHRICVFAGSNIGVRPEYAALARALGRTLAQRGLGLVYGGGRVGLMGALADALLEGGGEAIGVIPEALQAREVGHAGLHELHVVASMHERKAKMAELADAFVVLPGGLGTLEETFEVWTWAQLGFHRKPIGLLDICDYWRPMIVMLDRMVHEGFVDPEHRRVVCIGDEPAALLDRLRVWELPELARWLSPGET